MNAWTWQVLLLLVVGTALMPAEEVPGLIQDGAPAGIFAEGTAVAWTVTGVAPATAWTVEEPGPRRRIVAQGTVGDGRIVVTPAQPCWLRLRVATGPGSAVLERGVLTGPQTWAPAMAAPRDFDDFWSRQLAALDRIPPTAALRQVSTAEGVITWECELPQVEGRRVRGWLARPAASGSCPAVLICQYAGIYPLGPGAAQAYAKRGWMALNISAHDLPLQEKNEFYRRQEAGPLHGYPAIGCREPSTSYFRTMFLGCVQAARLLIKRPEWNGTLLVTGTSQGGLQALATAALVPETTATMVLMPAGCDTMAGTQDRLAGWPYWHAFDLPSGTTRDQALATSRYFDGVHFAARAHGAVLVGYGLLDTTSPPTAVQAMLNQVPGKAVGIALPQVSHHNHVRPEAYERERLRWESCLMAGEILPVR